MNIDVPALVTTLEHDYAYQNGSLRKKIGCSIPGTLKAIQYICVHQLAKFIKLYVYVK